MNDISQVFQSNGHHWATYIGNECLYRYGFGARPPSATPLVADIGTSYSVQQLLSIAYALLDGQLSDSDVLVCSSSRTAAALADVLNQLTERVATATLPRLEVVPNGVDPKRNNRDAASRQEMRTFLNCGPNDLVYLCFSRICPVSKLDFESTIRAWAQFIRTEPSAVLVIAGSVVTDPDYRAYGEQLLRLAASLGAGQQVVIMGDPHLQWPDAKTRLMSAADVFVHTTRGVEETTPLVVLEAMAHGLVPIVSDWAGLPELVRDQVDGIIVPTQTTPVAEQWEAGFGVVNDVTLREAIEQNVVVDEAELINAFRRMSQSTWRLGASTSSLRRVVSEFDIDDVAFRRLLILEEARKRSNRASIRPAYKRLFSPSRFIKHLAGTTPDPAFEGGS